MSDNMDNHPLVTERRLKEAMDKLDKHHPQIAGRLRTIWRREDEAWARGEPPPNYYEIAEPEPEPDYLRPTIWERFRLWFK